MVCRASMTLKGLEEYLEQIVKSGQDVDAAAEKAVVAAGDVILDGMQANAPIGDASKGDPHPGQLLHTLQVTAPEWDGNFVSVLIGMPPDAPADVARYGNAQEYGYQRGGKFYPPQSCIRKGFDGNRRAALGAEKEALQQAGVI